ncbi:MAG TPA: choice-of-anchor tandem repeat GloVer-containing protein [Candidatus Polarisedimenticolia bacterium]|nr:choice-of-anchor tandem repeat GloVer-containing protein [Candidatus Polarisedimenticolia bacterium]
MKSFTSAPDGAVPYCTLVAGTNSVLYGTTIIGGTSNLGTVFSMNLDGSGYNALHSFSGPTDGSGPFAGVLLGSDGKLYGTTLAGGSVSNAGTVFTLKTDGTEFAILHAFGGGTDGKNPEGGLIEGSDGMLYGTTYYTDSATAGTVFKIGKDGSGYTILHTFTTPDGNRPNGLLLEGSEGVLYGMAGNGGTHFGGAIFSMNKDGSGFTNLYFFRASASDADLPVAGLIEGSDHMLYGTTYQGGPGLGGTVFRINKNGTSYQILHDFSSTGNDMERPDGELLEGTDGALYGVADYASASPYAGGIFKINKDGSGYTALRNFAAGDGVTPKCALLRLANGVLYGTTERGGPRDSGCVFALSDSPLPPRLLSLTVSSNTNVLQLVATSGIGYDVLRSTDLSSWSVLATIVPPTNYSDLNPPAAAAFYRLQQH